MSLPSRSPRLVLGSASPARAGLLRAAGLAFEVHVSGVDEDAAARGLDPTDARAIAGALAAAKAHAVADEVAASPRPDALVLGCDSVLAHAGGVHGKPHTAEVAVARWRRMRGTAGTLVTGHTLLRASAGAVAFVGSAVVSTDVRFADVSDEDVDAYVATGEPLVVAGGFTLDGIGGLLVDGIDGCHTNVIGLSLPALRRLLADAGTPWWTLLA